MPRHGAISSDSLIEDTLGKGAPGGIAELDISGKIPAVRLGGAGADATKFLRGDRTWEVPVGVAGTAREDLVAQWDVSKTWANIGVVFVDAYVQANSDGKSVQIDTNGKTQVRLVALWNKIGTGVQVVQVIEVGAANVLISMDVISGRNVSALLTIPAGLANSVKFYKLQAKSTIAADDPILEGVRLYLK